MLSHSAVSEPLQHWRVDHQAPLYMGFPARNFQQFPVFQQEYWSGLSFPPPGDLPNTGIEPASLPLVEGFFTTEKPGKLQLSMLYVFFLLSQETAKFYSTMKIKSIRTGVNQQGPEWMQQKYKWNGMIEAYINSWTYVRNSSGFPKISAEWWDCESTGTLAWALKWKSSVQFSHSVVSNSLQPYGLKHTRPPCPSPTPKAYSNSCA